MSESSDKKQERYKEMTDDLGLSDLYRVPGWIHELMMNLLDAGWIKP